MADFGFDWGSDEDEDLEEVPAQIEDEQSTGVDTLEAAPAASGATHSQTAGDSTADKESSGSTAAAPAAEGEGGPAPSLPPGVVVHRVAASDRKANPHGTTESELLEPMIEDKAKQLEVKTLEHGEENLSPLEIFCQRSSSVFIFQRVWAAKEVGRLLARESKEIAMGVLVPIAMRLSDDRELFVRETMAQNLLPVLHFYFENKGFAARMSTSSDSAKSSVGRKSNDSAPKAADEVSGITDTDDGPETSAADAGEPSSAEGAATDANADAAAGDEEAGEPAEELSRQRSQTPPPPQIVPPIAIPTDDDFSTWLHRVLLTPHPSVSLPAQRATVALGRRLSFDRYHTEIVHGVILGLVQNPLHQHLMLQRQRSKEMVVKSRPPSTQSLTSSSSSSSLPSPKGRSSGDQSPSQQEQQARGNKLSSGFASLFGRRSWQSEKMPSASQASGGDGDDDAAGSSGESSRSRDRSNTAPSSSPSDDYLDFDDISHGGSPGTGFFVSPADEEARLERTRRKLLMLHMIHLVAVEFGAKMRPAVFVPVVERSCSDKAFEVRRDAAAVLGSLAKAVSVDLALDVLFQCFLSLTQDAIWQVRQSAARHALPGLALVLAARNDRALLGSPRPLPEFERKHTLQWFAKSPPLSAVGSSTASVRSSVSSLSSNLESLQRLSVNTSIGRSLQGQLSIDSDCDSGSDGQDPLNSYMYKNQPHRSVPDRQWLQLVDRLAGPREPSHHVRAAVFESIGKLALALIDCPRTRDTLVSLAINDVQRASSDQGSSRFGLFGSSGSLQDLDDDDDELDEETAAAEEANIVMTRALGEVHGAPSSRGKDLVSGGRGGPAVAGAVGGGNGRLAKIRAQRAVSKDILYQCAYNFPALLAALGSQGWERLRDVYMQLSKAEHYEARKTLACSLHEVARIMASSSMHDAQGLSGESPGPSFSADLESVLCLFLIDGAEIKMGALAHLGDTLTWLTPTSRVRCLPMIMQVFKHDGKQWRTRELMATQLVKLCHLFPASVVVGSLLPQAVDWAHDPVAGVRAAVAPAFPIMFELTKLDPTTQVRFFETVISFSHADTFRGRLFFVEICSALLAHDQDPDADPVDFDQFFLPSLAALATDRVANVRIALARLVRRMLENRMRRQSISATLADMWISSTPADGSLSPSAAAGAAHLDSVHTSTSPGGQHVRVGDLEDRADEWVDESSDGHNNGTSWSPSSPTTRHRRSSGANGGNRNSAPPGTRASAGGRGIQKRLSRKAAPLSRHRSLSRGSGDGSISPRLSANSAAKFYSHRSFGSVASMRRRRNTTPMRAHLLATMVQQLAKDTDRDVLDLVRDLPGLPIVSADSPRTPTVGTIEEHSPLANSFEAATAAEGAGEAGGDSGSGRRGSQLMAFPRPPPSPPLAPQELPPSSPPPPSQEMSELNLDDVPGSPGVPAASAFSANVPVPHVDGGGNEVGSAAEDHTLGISAISHPPEVNAATPATAATANNVAAASLTIPSKGEHLQALDSDGSSKPALKFPELKRPDQAKIHNETSASVPL